MRGFLVGTMAMIVLYVAVQPGTASKAQQGGSLLVSGMQRLLSPDVALIHWRKSTGTTPSTTSTTRSTGTVTV